MKFLRLNHEKFCINRNIVECKDQNDRSEYDPAWVLIETLWNVKMREIP